MPNLHPILLAQLPVPQLAPQECTGNLPLAGATLIVHAHSSGGAPELQPRMVDQSLQSRAGDAAMVERLAASGSSCVGFTCAVWNVERTAWIARRLRERAPNVKILLGGPEIAVDAPVVLDTQPCFDWAIEGEGEGAVAAMLAGASPDSIDGVLLPGGLRASGRVAAASTTTLSSIHDPFISGLVRPEADGVMFAEFLRGCKYRCSFCHYHQGRAGASRAERPRKQIAEIFAWARAHGLAEIGLLDPSLEQRDDFAGFLDFIASVNTSSIGIFCELRADFVDDTLAAKLHAAGVRTVETGLQSVSAEALRASHRSVHLERFRVGAEALLDRGITMRTDVMAGLPGDSPEGLTRTLEFVAENGLVPHMQLFRTQVLPGTTLRTEASALGVRYDEGPPYLVRSTPTWDEDDLDGCFARSEDLLDTSFAPEERPVLAERSSQAAATTRYHDAGVAWHYWFDLDHSDGVRAAGAELFDEAAAAVTLHLRTSAPAAHTAPARNLVERFIAANPFCALSVVVELPPHAPLDILDELDAACEANQHGSYVTRMFPTAATIRPLRRVFAMLPSAKHRGTNREWLDRVRDVAEVIWSLPCDTAESALRSAAHIRMGGWDYVFLDIPSGALGADVEAFCIALAKTCRCADSLLLPGLQLHWAMVRVAEALP